MKKFRKFVLTSLAMCASVGSFGQTVEEECENVLYSTSQSDTYAIKNTCDDPSNLNTPHFRVTNGRCDKNEIPAKLWLTQKEIMHSVHFIERSGQFSLNTDYLTLEHGLYHPDNLGVDIVKGFGNEDNKTQKHIYHDDGKKVTQQVTRKEQKVTGCYIPKN